MPRRARPREVRVGHCSGMTAEQPRAAVPVQEGKRLRLVITSISGRVRSDGRRVSAEGGEKAFSFFCGLFASCGYRERTFCAAATKGLEDEGSFRRGGLRLGLPWVLVAVAA